MYLDRRWYNQMLSHAKKINEDNNNEDIVMLPESIFVQVINTDLHNVLAENIMKDEIVTDAIEVLKLNGIPPIKSALSDWKMDNSLLFFKGKCYVPDNEDLRRNIVRRYHDLVPSGHPGQYGTLELVQRKYWWPRMFTFVKKYVEGCASCQQMKVNTHPTSPPISPIPAPADALPFSNITMDFVTDLPENTSDDSVLVVVDHVSTKGVISTPCNKKIDALGTANLILNNVYW